MPLPECFNCAYADHGFPCRSVDGTLNYAKIAAGYVAHGRQIAEEIDAGRESGESETEREWAADCAYQITHDHPEHALQLLVHLMDACETVRDVGFVAAGAVEDTVCSHGPVLADTIGQLIAASPKFAMFLSAMWGRNRCDPGVWAYLSEALAKSPRFDDDPRTLAATGKGPVLSEPALLLLLANKVVPLLKW